MAVSSSTYQLVTRDAILDGMVAALEDVTAAVDEPVSSTRYLHSVGRYMGELRNVEAFKRGVAGRCPAVRVAFVSDQSRSITIGRRTERVEAQFACVVFSDNAKSKDARETLLRTSEKVQKLLSSRALGLAISPLRHRTTAEIAAIEHCTAYNVTFSTKYRVDYTVDPGTDAMETASGDVHTDESVDEAEQRTYGEIDVPLNQESE